MNMTENQKQARRDLDNALVKYNETKSYLNYKCKERGCKPGHCMGCDISIKSTEAYREYCQVKNDFKYRFKFIYDPMYFIDDGVPDYMIWTRELWYKHLKIWQDE